jgi:hypothetical protein
VLGSLNHPNVVRQYETFMAGNKLCIVMELAPAGGGLGWGLGWGWKEEALVPASIRPACIAMELAPAGRA